MDGKKSATAKPRRLASKAPPPIIPVGVGYRPPRPKPTQTELDWPSYFPNDLLPQATVILCKAAMEHPVPTIELYTQFISNLTPYLCAAVRSRALRADLVLLGMSDLLDSLLVYNCDDESGRFRLKQELMVSDEWLKLAEEMARVPSVGRPQGQPGETTGHKDAKHVKEQKQGKPFEIGKEVHSLIPRYREGLTLLRKAKITHPTETHIWKNKLLQEGFSEKEVGILIDARKPESAAYKIVAQKHPEMELKTIRNHYSTFKHS